jgi:Arc/MetJ-type ribon-helix-helix transcriptional regulator
MGMTLSPEVEERIAAKIRNGAYKSPSDVVQAGLQLLEAAHAVGPQAHRAIPVQDTRPIWEIAADIMKDVPAEAWDQVPTDLARNHKHYLYGAPREDAKSSE